MKNFFCHDNIEKKRVTGFQLKLEVVQEIKRDKNFTIEICGGRGGKSQRNFSLSIVKMSIDLVNLTGLLAPFES